MVQPSSPTPEREDLGYLMGRALLRWNALLAERCRAYGFSEVRPAFGAVLLPLYETNGLRMGDLARRARLSKQTVTTLVREADKVGLVYRRRDPSDRRATTVHLTPRAEQFRAVADQILEEMHSLVEDALSPRSLATLKRGLRTIMLLDGEA